MALALAAAFSPVADLFLFSRHVCTHGRTYQSTLEVSGTWCLHLHYLEAVKSIPVCLSLHGPVTGLLGMAAWLEVAGTQDGVEGKGGAVEVCVLNPLTRPA